MSCIRLPRTVAIAGVVSLVFLLLQADCFARVGGGGSIGSRGSRTYSSPSRSSGSSSYHYQPRSTYSQPSTSRPYNQPAPSPTGGFFRNMMGGLAGGFLGALLFRSLGFGAPGGGWGGGGGFGFFDILLVAAVVFGIYWFIKRRRQRAMGGSYYTGVDPVQGDYGASYQDPRYRDGMIDAPSPSLQEPFQGGSGSIRQADPHFDEQAFKDFAMDVFFKVQGAWAERNPGLVGNLLTPEMLSILEKDAEQLRREKKLNKLDNIAVRSVDITEDWREPAGDFVTVKFYANLLDYVVDDTTGQVVSGSKTEPVKFEEYWTFVRPTGSREWRLSAITQPD